MRSDQDAAIRRAGAADLETVSAISEQAYTPAYLAVIGEVPKPAYEDYRPRIERREVWILEVSHQPAGVVVLEVKDDHLLVYSIAVLPAHQGRGYAGVLLKFAERQALASGLRVVRLYTNERMRRNVALYLRCGFTRIGSHPHPSRVGEMLVDMEKVLADERL